VSERSKRPLRGSDARRIIFWTIVVVLAFWAFHTLAQSSYPATPNAEFGEAMLEPTGIRGE
jgi:hypothetical protein